MAQDTRKRHMVDISDYAWDKLERLANRLDASQYVYKGRPRYGKLLELAIEKLEDSTMEWTVEEVEWGNEIPELDYDNGPLPIDEHYTEATEDWWIANPNIAAGKASENTEKLAASFKKAEQIAQGFSNPDPATIHEADVWTYPSNGNFTSVGTTLKLHARTDKEWTSEQVTQVQDAVSYAISGAAWFVKPFHASFIGGVGYFEYAAVINIHNSGVMDFVIERAKSSLRHVLMKLGLSGTKQHPPLHKIKAEYDAKKSATPVPIVMWKASEPGYIELTGTITQALSAPEYTILRGFTYAAFAEFSSDEGENALSVTVKKVPWNKLWISATYADPSKLLKKLPDVGEAVAKRVEAWLLQGNFIGPLPQAVDITDKSTGKTYQPIW